MTMASAHIPQILAARSRPSVASASRTAAVCLAVAHVLLDLNWKTDAVLAGSLAVAGAVIAVGGCALALGSGLVQRGYVPANR